MTKIGMKAYTGAIFDMDGVLFDTERVYQQTWHEIARDRGIALEEGLDRAVSGTNGDVMRRVIERYYHVPDGMEIMVECKRRIREKLSRTVPLKPGVHEILDFFRFRNIRLAIASSSAPEQIRSNLALSGLGPYFDAVISGEEVQNGKPDPEIFLRAAAALGCAPGSCFVFEDSLSGVRAGHAAGCDTVMVPDLIPPTPEILPLCFRVCESLNDALNEIRDMLEAPAMPSK